MLGAWVCFAASPDARAEGDISPLDMLTLEERLAEQAQRKVLDPILGPWKASVFAKAKLVVLTSGRESSKSGKGQASKEGRKSDPVSISTGHASWLEDEWAEHVLQASTGPSKSSSILLSTGPYQRQTAVATGQYAEQSKSESETYSSIELKIERLRFAIVFDDKVPSVRVESAKKVLLAVYQDALKPEDLTWVPAPFAAPPRRAP